MTAADRFREAADRLDVDGMAGALAPDVRLHSPVLWAPVEGREQARMIFGILAELFEDFEYTRAMVGEAVDPPAGIASTHALVFRCRVGAEIIEGVDVLDIDDQDQVAILTVFIRPLAGLQALAQAIAARMAASRPPGPGEARARA